MKMAEIFEDIGILLNEGGGGSRVGQSVVFSVEVTQKVPSFGYMLSIDLAWFKSSDHKLGNRIVQALNTMLRTHFHPVLLVR